MPQVAFCFCHGIVGFELASAYVSCELVVGQGTVQGIVVGKRHMRHLVGHFGHQFGVFVIVEECPEGEHGVFEIAFACGQVGTCVEQVEFHLQKVVLADLPHGAFFAGHLVEARGVFMVLPGYFHVFACHQQRKIVADGGHGHLFCGA